MKLSVVTPSFNQGRFIERTIDSVLSQGITDLEYWVIDAGSKDQTLDVLKKYGDRLKWISEKDDGQADAVNKGIRLSSGEVIGWLNSDDVYYPGALSRVLEIFAQHPDVEILYGDADHIDELDNFIEAYPIEEWNYERLLETCYICQPAVFFRRSVVDKFGLIDSSLQYCMDYEYWLRVGKSVELYHLPEKLAGSRFYPENKTLGCREKVHAEILDMICKKTEKFSLLWAANLGHIIAEERGVRRDSAWQQLQFIRIVVTTIVREKRRYGYALNAQDYRLFISWVRPVFKKLLWGNNR